MSACLRLRVTHAAESILRGGHPWLFAESIREQNRPGELGELAVIYDRQDRFLAIGLFDPESPLRVRVLHRGKPAPINRDWWRAHLHAALERRSPLFDERTTGFRWIHGESDGWPGLVLDRYADTLVVKLYTAAWFPHWGEIASLIQEALTPTRLVLRLSRNIQSLALRNFQRREGEILFGPPVAETIVFEETGIRFEADVLRGQKTGFFLDQRENRRKIESLAQGRDVLNVFSFSGGFSLYAARGGARSVTDADMSSFALEAADRNFTLNQSDAQISRCPHQTVQADAFEWLERPGGAYDLIVLDPPSLAKKEVERAGALQGYRRLARLALPHLRPGGILMAASCSAHVSAPEFFAAVRETVGRSGRSIEDLGTTLQPPDHPATFPEAEYLKAVYFRFVS